MIDGVPPATILRSRKPFPRSSSSVIESPCPLMFRLQSSGSSTISRRAEVDLRFAGEFEPMNLMNPPAKLFQVCVVSLARDFIVSF